MSHKCLCSPKCRARVKTTGKDYARGHSPDSHEDYEQRGSTLSKTIRRKQKAGTYVNAFKGKKHSMSTRKHLSAERRRIAADPKHQEIFAEAMRNRSPEASLANIKKATEARTGGKFPHMEKTKKKISRTRRARMRLGLIKPHNKGAHGIQVAWNKGLNKKTDKRVAKYAHGLHIAYLEGRKLPAKRSDWKEYYNGPMGRILMACHLEVRFAQWCDQEKMLWLYEPKVFKMKNRQSYRPDFYLPDRDLWVDMKGEYRPENKAKIERFRKQYPDIELFVLFDEEMKALEKVSKAA